MPLTLTDFYNQNQEDEYDSMDGDNSNSEGQSGTQPLTLTDFYNQNQTQEQVDDGGVKPLTLTDFYEAENQGNIQIEEQKKIEQAQNAIFTDEYDPKKAKVFYDRGQVPIADKGVFDRSNKAYLEKRQKYLDTPSGDEQMSDTLQKYNEDLLKNDPAFRLKTLGRQPVWMPHESMLPRVTIDTDDPQNIDKARVERQDVGSRFSELVRSVPDMEVPDELLTEQPVYEVDKFTDTYDETPLEVQQQRGDVRSAIQEQQTNLAYNKYADEVIEQERQEAERKRKEDLNRDYGSSFMSGIANATDMAMRGLASVEAGFQTIVSEVLGQEGTFEEKYNYLKENNIFGSIRKGVNMDMVTDAWDKKAKKTLMGQVISGLGTGLIDVATLRGTAFLKALNFPIHSAIKKLGDAEIKDIGDIGKAIAVGGAEGYVMDRILHLAPKIFPKTVLNVSGKRIPVLFNQQFGTGVMGALGAEVTHAVTPDSGEMTMEDRFATFWTMALMGGRSRGKTHEVMTQKTYNKHFKGSDRYSRKYNTFSTKMEKMWEGKQTPEKIKKFEEFQEDINRQIERLGSLGKYSVSKLRNLDKNPTKKRKMQEDIYKAYEKVGINLEPYEVQQNIEIMANSLERTPLNKSLVKEVEMMEKAKKITPTQASELQQHILENKGTYKSGVPKIVRNARVEMGFDKTEISTEKLSPKKAMEKNPEQYESVVIGQNEILRNRISKYDKDVTKVEDIEIKKANEAEYSKKNDINEKNIKELREISEMSYDEMSPAQRELVYSRGERSQRGLFSLSDNGSVIYINPKTGKKTTFSHEWTHKMEGEIRENNPKLFKEIEEVFGRKKKTWGREDSEHLASKVEEYYKQNEFKNPKELELIKKIMGGKVSQDILNSPYTGKPVRQEYSKVLDKKRKIEETRIKNRDKKRLRDAEKLKREEAEVLKKEEAKIKKETADRLEENQSEEIVKIKEKIETVNDKMRDIVEIKKTTSDIKEKKRLEINFDKEVKKKARWEAELEDAVLEFRKKKKEREAKTEEAKTEEVKVEVDKEPVTKTEEVTKIVEPKKKRDLMEVIDSETMFAQADKIEIEKVPRKAGESWEKRRGDGIEVDTYSTPVKDGEYTSIIVEQAKKIIREEGFDNVKKALLKKKQYGNIDVKMAKIIAEKLLKTDFVEGAKLVRKLAVKGTELGRAVQAFDFFIDNRISKGNVADFLTHIENMVLKQWKDPAKFRAALKKKTGKETIFTEENYLKFEKAAEKLDALPNESPYEQRHRDRVEQGILNDMGKNLPKTAGSKASSFQVIMQLMNAKTLIRNYLGNQGFYATETVSQATIGEYLDSAMRYFTGINSFKTAKRGKGDELFSGAEEKKWSSIKGKDKWNSMGDHLNEMIEFNVDNMTKYVKGFLGKKGMAELTKMGLNPKHQAGKFDIATARTFAGDKGLISKGLHHAEKQLKRLLLGPDRKAFVRTFEKSMKQQVEAYNMNLRKGVKKLTEPTSEMAVEAYQDGLHATFQDMNVVSKMSTKLKRVLNENIQFKGYGLGELIMKYPKTPANLIHRAFEYSPLGLANGLWKARNAIKMIKGMQSRGELILDSAEGKANMVKAMGQQRTAVKKLVRGITGTGLSLLGYVLFNNDIITAGKTDDKKKTALLQALGIRNYSYKGVVSLDWLQPIIDPILVGADLAQMINGSDDMEEASALGMAGLAISNYIDVMSESIEGQGVLKGVKTMFGKGSMKDGFIDIMKQAPASFFPTLLSQLRYAVDPKLREVYKKDETGLDKFFSTMVRMVANKLPIASGELDARKTITGEDMSTLPLGTNSTADYVLNAIFAFASPAIIQANRKDEDLEWVLNNHKAMKNSRDVWSDKRYMKDIRYKKKKYEVTPEMREQYMKAQWKDSQPKIEALRKSRSFAKKSYNERLRILQKIYSDARKRAIAEVAKSIKK